MVDRRAIHLKRVGIAGAAAKLVFTDEALGIEVFERPIKAESVIELAFSGMRCKPDYHYRFKSSAEAQAHREEWLVRKRARLEEKRARVVARREAALDPSKRLKVGDVLVASWGYEQTNFDYYQVTRVIGSQTVEIRELAQSAAEDGACAMQGDCVPLLNHFVGDAMVKRVNEEGRVKVRSWGVWASKKEPTTVAGMQVFAPDHFTSYA